MSQEEYPQHHSLESIVEVENHLIEKHCEELSELKQLAKLSEQRLMFVEKEMIELKHCHNKSSEKIEKLIPSKTLLSVGYSVIVAIIGWNCWITFYVVKFVEQLALLARAQ